MIIIIASMPDLSAATNITCSIVADTKVIISPHERILSREACCSNICWPWLQLKSPWTARLAATAPAFDGIYSIAPGHSQRDKSMNSGGVHVLILLSPSSEHHRIKAPRQRLLLVGYTALTVMRPSTLHSNGDYLPVRGDFTAIAPRPFFTGWSTKNRWLISLSTASFVRLLNNP